MVHVFCLAQQTRWCKASGLCVGLINPLERGGVLAVCLDLGWCRWVAWARVCKGGVVLYLCGL